MKNCQRTFLINDNLQVNHGDYKGTKIYFIDNFYKFPGEVHYSLKNEPVSLWKGDYKPTYNGEYFHDYRHELEIEELKPAYEFIQGFLPNSIIPDNYPLVTNITKFEKDKFNDYENNYWWPHKDRGYTGIVYLNYDPNHGTNLYESVKEDVEKGKEHQTPWRPKTYWKIDETIQSVFNRLVVFEGDKFFHGANISDQSYFEEHRINQVFFLDKG